MGLQSRYQRIRLVINLYIYTHSINGKFKETFHPSFKFFISVVCQIVVNICHACKIHPIKHNYFLGFVICYFSVKLLLTFLIIYLNKSSLLFKTGSTCEAIVCTQAAARDVALNIHGEEKITKLVVYASDQTHISFQKAAKLIGIPPRNFRVLPTSSATDFALSPTTLRASIEVDLSQGLVPFYICATIGATPSGAVDPIDGLGQIARDYGAWLHVDAAFAGDFGFSLVIIKIFSPCFD